MSPGSPKFLGLHRRYTVVKDAVRILCTINSNDRYVKQYNAYTKENIHFVEFAALRRSVG